jgi:hypothetical protein
MVANREFILEEEEEEAKQTEQHKFAEDAIPYSIMESKTVGGGGRMSDQKSKEELKKNYIGRKLE